MSNIFNIKKRKLLSLAILSTHILGFKNVSKIVISNIGMVLLEILSVALLIPLLRIAQDEHPQILNYDISLYLSRDINLISLLGFLFFTYVLLKNIFIYIFNRIKNNLIFEMQNRLSKIILQRYISKKFTDFSCLRISELIRNVISEVGHFVSAVLLGVELVSELVIFSALVLILVYVNNYFILFFMFYFLCGYLIHSITKKRIYATGFDRQISEKLRIAVIQNIYNSIKEIKIYKAESFYLKKYDIPNKIVAKTHAYENTIRPISKYFFETLTILLLCIYAHIYGSESNFYADFIIIFAALFRLLPSFNKLLVIIQQLTLHTKSLRVVYDLYSDVGEDVKSNIRQPFIEVIQTFSFHLKKFQFSNGVCIHDFMIHMLPHEKIILLKARSGYGKSVALSCMAGLYEADVTYLINGVEIAPEHIIDSNIFSYNTQSAPLLNASIIDNITFCSDEVDSDLLKLAIQITELESFIKNQPSGLDTLISDRGHNFSGGQAQRILLARTIYQRRKIMILDESLSALDNESQLRIITNLKNFYDGKIILVSHDDIDLTLFDKVINVK